MEDLKKYYEVGELNTDEQPQPSHAVSAAKKQPGHAKRKEQLEQQLTRVSEESQKLTELMLRAQVKEGEEVSPTRLEALGELVQQFYKLANKVKVNLKEALLDGNGKNLRKFAMKELDEEKGDRQLAKLEEDMKTVRKYFPHIELKEITTADEPPKRIAVMLGIEAEEFNAIIMAQKQLALYEKEMKSTKEAIVEANAAIETERALRKAGQAAKIAAQANEADTAVFH